MITVSKQVRFTLLTCLIYSSFDNRMILDRIQIPRKGYILTLCYSGAICKDRRRVTMRMD